MSKRKKLNPHEDTRDRATGLPQARLRLAAGIQRVIDLHDADRECRHGSLPKDPTLGCLCWEMSVSQVEKLLSQLDRNTELLGRLMVLTEEVASRMDAIDRNTAFYGREVAELRQMAKRKDKAA